MAIPGFYASTWVDGIESSSVQPAGIDLSVAEIHRFITSGRLGKHQRILAKTEPIEPINGVWRLNPGPYKVIYKEVVKVPYDCLAFLLPRSSLMRMGAILFSAIWDPGYIGRGEGLLVIFNPFGIEIEKESHIGQLIFIKLESLPHIVYKGVYQFERVK